MISAGDFRNGVTFELDGQVVQVIEFQHVKPGKGAAFVRTKYKNVITGAVVEKSFNPMISTQQHLSKEKIWNIATKTVAYITLWIQKHGNRFLLVLTS